MELSISSPSLRSRASTITAGRRTAKLLPHLETCIEDIPNLLYIHASLEATRGQSRQRATGNRSQGSAGKSAPVELFHPGDFRVLAAIELNCPARLHQPLFAAAFTHQ